MTGPCTTLQSEVGPVMAPLKASCMKEELHLPPPFRLFKLNAAQLQLPLSPRTPTKWSSSCCAHKVQAVQPGSQPHLWSEGGPSTWCVRHNVPVRQTEEGPGSLKHGQTGQRLSTKLISAAIWPKRSQEWPRSTRKRAADRKGEASPDQRHAWFSPHGPVPSQRSMHGLTGHFQEGS